MHDKRDANARRMELSAGLAKLALATQEKLSEADIYATAILWEKAFQLVGHSEMMRSLDLALTCCERFPAPATALRLLRENPDRGKQAEQISLPSNWQHPPEYVRISKQRMARAKELQDRGINGFAAMKQALEEIPWAKKGKQVVDDNRADGGNKAPQRPSQACEDDPSRTKEGRGEARATEKRGIAREGIQGRRRTLLAEDEERRRVSLIHKANGGMR